MKNFRQSEGERLVLVPPLKTNSSPLKVDGKGNFLLKRSLFRGHSFIFGGGGGKYDVLKLPFQPKIQDKFWVRLVLEKSICC